LDQAIHLLSPEAAPPDMGAKAIEQFLNHLAVDGNVPASNQTQTLSALVFLCQEILRQDFENGQT